MPASMDRLAHQLEIQLDPQKAARLERLARLADVPEATLAQSLLSKAIDDADPDASSTTAILDGIPGAYERAIRGLEEARAGESIALDDL
jgi:hypothetical protein